MHRPGERFKSEEYKLFGAKSIVKILLILFTCLGFACIVVSHLAFGDDYTDEYQHRYILFFGSHLFGMLESIVILGIFLAKLDQVFGGRRLWEIVNLMISFVLSILCGIASGLMLYYADKLYNNRLYKTNTEYWKWYTDHLLVAISCGFLNTILYLVDTALHANAFR